MNGQYRIKLLSKITTAIAGDISQLMKKHQPNTANLSISALKKIVANPLTHILVAIDKKNNVIGMITIVSYLTLHNTYKTWFEDLFVDESVRRQGIGQALIKQAMSLAKKLKIKVVNFTSRPCRIAANQLYKKLGFKLYQTNHYKYKL